MGACVTFWDARRPTCWPAPGRGQAGGQGVADAAGQPAVPAQPHEGRLGALPLPLGPCGRSRLGSSRARLFFLALMRAAGQCFSWPRRGFPLPAIKKAAAVHFRLAGSLSILAIETLLALHGAELPSWWGVLQLS